MSEGDTYLPLPEFTRSLRGFAGMDSIGDADHDLVFGPLLTARKAAARVSGAEGQLAAFDAPRLRGSLRDALAAMAADRFPSSAADRRALAARLEEPAAPVLQALDRVEREAALVRLASTPTRRASWLVWVDAVRALFRGADRFWTDAHPVLGDVRAGAARTRRRVLGVVAFAALGAIGARAAGAQHVTLRVPGVPAESLLARGFDVVSTEPGAALVVADPRERARLESFGWVASVILRPRGGPELDVAREGPTATRVFRAYDDPQRGVRAFIDSLAKANPRVSVDTLGLSYDKRPMLAVKIGPKGDSPSRPNVLFMAAYHAREWAATEMALRLIGYLANPVAGNARLDSLLQSRDIWIVPVANPDGYQYTFARDRLWRKTRSPQAQGATGVDMNRNHRQNWALDDNGSSPDPGSEIFRGPSPASEIEVRNIEAFHAAHPPVVSVSYHSYAGLILYPPGSKYGERPAELGIYRALAGTNLRSAVTDHLPGSSRSFYSPSNAWMLYATNGEYNEWASTQHGTISVTPEITSGYENGSYYGFEFPDDEARLQTLFTDNLPFALDVIESARDPLAYVSPTTLGHADRLVLESVSPDIRAVVPAALASGATIGMPTTVPFRVDSAAGGRYLRRLVTGSSNRPRSISVTVGGQTSNFSVLEMNGAEKGENGWTATQFRADSNVFLLGRYSWGSPGGIGELRSQVVRASADVDTVTLAFWTKYDGSGFDERPHGTVRVSTDSGASWRPVMRVQGYAPTWYADRVTVGGVKGKPVVFGFVSSGMPWFLDEIAIVAHTKPFAAPIAGSVAIRPSENPVRRGAVFFPWPLDGAAGDLFAYDFSGRLVWKTRVSNRETSRWDLQSGAVPNGVYVVIARSGSQTVRLKLFVVRDGS